MKPVTYLKRDDSTGLYYECDKEYGFPVYTHPVKEHFEDEPQAEELHEILQSNAELTDEEILEIASPMFEDARYPSTALDFARAILRKAQEADKIESLGTVNIGGIHYRNGKEVK